MTTLGALFAAVAVLVTVAGGLLSVPLGRAGLNEPFHLAFGAVGVVLFLAAGSRLQRPVAWVLPVFVAAFAAWAPQALARTPDPEAGQLEVSRMVLCFALALAVLGGTRGRSVGLAGMRLGWFAGLLLMLGIAGWELATRQHLWISESHPWPFGDARLAVGTYINPNNFATALVAMITGSVALSTQLASRAARAVVLVAVGLGCATVVITQSRSGLAALLVVLALTVRRLVEEHTEATGLSVSARLARLPRRAVWALRAALVAAVALVIAAFVVPALAARNPLARMIVDQFNEETARSDTLRVQLLAAAWRYLRESGWLGTGAGSFEHLLYNDPNPGTIKLTNLHNAFMELLAQYGVHVGGLYALGMAAVIAALVRSRDVPGSAARVTRHEALGYLTALLALGVTASSALHVTTWWVMHAAVCASAWQLSAQAKATATE